jgi:hypothetical protein
MTDTDPQAPEFESVESFIEYLCDDDRTEFTHGELAALNARLHVPTRLLRRELEGYGLTLRGQAHEVQVRTYLSNPHDRWSGPGSSPTHGGSGWEQIAGMAGQVG